MKINDTIICIDNSGYEHSLILYKLYKVENISNANSRQFVEVYVDGRIKPVECYSSRFVVCNGDYAKFLYK